MTVDEIRKELQQKAREAIEETDQKGLEATKKNTQDFYSGGTPELYVRTGQLGNSPKSTGVSGGGNTYESKIYLDVGGTSYMVPNPLFDFDGTGRFSHYSSDEVFDAAENGHSHVVGKPGFWKKSDKEIEQIFDSSVSKRFS